MKRVFKTLLTVFTLVLVLVTLVACGGGNGKNDPKVDYQKILDNYLLEIDGTTVSKDFTLPNTITFGDATYNITWESSDTCVTLSVRDEDFLAVVSYPDAAKEVTLTLTLNGLTKTFKVRVAALDVYSFMDAYAFAKDKATVVDDIALDTEFEYKGKKAEIAWSVEEEYSEYLEISADGKTCKVFTSSLNPTVKIKATFKYNGEEASKSYRMVVSQPMSKLEEVNNWYTNVGTTIDIEGYVVAIGDAYSKSYGNITVYVIDKDFEYGYYLYRVKADEANGTKVEPGCYVKVSGITSYAYHGLIEASSTGTLVVDSSVAKINPTDYVYKFDNDLLGGVPAAVYHESRIVSLDNWEVKSVNAKHSDASPTTLLTLTKNGVDIKVVYTKYFLGEFAYKADDPKVAAMLAKVATINKGDFVSIEGVLGCYDGFQIGLLNADGIKAGAADAEGTTYAGVKVGALIKENAKLIPNGIVVADKEINFLAKNEAEDVTVKFELCSKSNAVTIDGGKFTIVPTAKREKVNVQATYTCGDYSTVVFFVIDSKKMSDEEQCQAELDAYEVEEGYNAGVNNLAANGKTFENVKFVYEVVDAESAKLASVDGNKIRLLPVDAETTVKVKLIAKLGEASKEKEIELKIKVSDFTKYTAVKPEAGKGYKFGMNHETLGKWLFLNGSVNSTGYGLTETDYSKAPDFFVEEVEGGYYIYTMVNNAKKYYNLLASADYNNQSFDDAAKTVWTYNEAHKTFTTLVNGHTTASKDGVYYTGGYGTFDTCSASLESYLKSCDIDGATSFCNKMYIVEKDEATTAQRAQAVADSLKFSMAKKGDEIELPTNSALYNDVEIAWTLVGGAANKAAIEAAFLADFNAKNNRTLTTAADIDSSKIESSWLVAMMQDEALAAKWAWLYKAIYEAAGKPEGKEFGAEGTDLTAFNTKGFYLVNLNGFFTGTKFHDGAFGDAADWTVAANCEAVLAKAAVSTQFAELFNGKLAIINESEKVEEVTLKATVTCGLAKVEKDITVKVDAMTFTDKNAEQVYDIAKAGEVANQSVSFPGYYVFSGFVSSKDKYNNIYVSIDGTTNKQIECYKLVNDAVNVGDYVKVKGKLVNYKGTIELDSGCTLEGHAKIVKKTMAEVIANQNGKAYLDKAAVEAAFFADFNKKNNCKLTAATLDTANGESSWMAAFLSDADLVAKWGWLLDAICDAAGNANMKTSAEGFAATSSAVKGFYFANLNGYFTGRSHKDTYLETQSADWTVAATVKAVTDKIPAVEVDKTTLFYVEGMITKVVNTAGGNYKTGNFMVSDGTGEVEAYKLGYYEAVDVSKAQLAYDNLLLGLKIGDTIGFYGTWTTYNKVVETNNAAQLAYYKAEPAKSAFYGTLAKIVDLGIINKVGEVALPAALSFDGVSATVNYSIKEEGVTCANIAEGKLVVTALPTDDTTITIVAAVACGEELTKSVEIKATISQYATVAKLTLASKIEKEAAETKVVWQENNVTLTNEKGTSTTSCTNNNKAPYYNPTRIYKDQTLKIEYTGMERIIVHCAGGYADEFVGGTIATGTMVQSGDDVVITFDSAVDSVLYTCSKAATRITSIEICKKPA